jgi:EAL domain-containing protein (putative c-di-GMP-specific phosphodiesterase class I)
VGVNLAGEQLQPASVDRIIQRITDSGLSRWLWLEITEQALVESRHFVARSLEELRSSGVVIAIDDFGTGYASLRYLHRFPADIIKIDRSYVQDIARDPAAARIVGTLWQLFGAIGLTAVAEGVEDPAQAAMLIELGCPVGQGYLYGRPAPLNAVVDPSRVSTGIG